MRHPTVFARTRSVPLADLGRAGSPSTADLIGPDAAASDAAAGGWATRGQHEQVTSIVSAALAALACSAGHAPVPVHAATLTHTAPSHAFRPFHASRVRRPHRSRCRP
jgi:hypothetical protein